MGTPGTIQVAWAPQLCLSTGILGGDPWGQALPPQPTGSCTRAARSLARRCHLPCIIPRKLTASSSVPSKNSLELLIIFCLKRKHPREGRKAKQRGSVSSPLPVPALRPAQQPEGSSFPLGLIHPPAGKASSDPWRARAGLLRPWTALRARRGEKLK